MSKSDYRSYFAKCMEFLKIRYFLDLADINSSNFSRFLHGLDWTVSIEKLEYLKSIIENVISDTI
ncbi:hypothetical protein [Solobacterium moorei]|uniref:hypothetical protein n=1 Tax=Solobacterium moorei TaxID=102148 RepID=UPI002B2CF01E|nr:hypothetical protein RGT18_13950 [Solobacterium moorei]